MIENLRNGNFVLIAIIFVAILMVVFSIKSHTTHTDIVIKTDTEEFVVDDYTIEMNRGCIYFTYDGRRRIICGDYEIIE
jgi:hypothetical protein